MKRVFPAFFVLASCFLSGCASTPQGGSTPERARDYYPLAVGNSWTYRISPAPDGMQEGQVVLVGEEQGLFRMNVGGAVGARATSVTDGVRNLLEEPLEVGHQWIAVPSPSTVERYRVVETNAEVKVPAGHFRGCVRVETEQDVTRRDGAKGRLVGVWTYAPFVGPVHFVQHVEMADAPSTKNIEYELLRYDLAPEVTGK